MGGSPGPVRRSVLDPIMIGGDRPRCDVNFTRPGTPDRLNLAPMVIDKSSYRLFGKWLRLLKVWLLWQP